MKAAVKRLAYLIAHGVGDHFIESRERDVRDVLALTREYVRLCELQIKLGMSDEEARTDAPDRLTASEVVAALEGDPHDETDRDPL